MIITNESTTRRLKMLKLSLEEIKKCYNETLRDHNLDVGIEYGKKYPYLDKETSILFNQADELGKLRELKLYDSIFHFSQVFFSIKEYLRKDLPQHKSAIEEFFSEKPISRKNISNDLKHNPENDLEYKSLLIQQKPNKEIRSKSTTYSLKKNYFYEGKDALEHCSTLYNDLMVFIDNYNV